MARTRRSRRFDGWPLGLACLLLCCCCLGGAQSRQAAAGRYQDVQTSRRSSACNPVANADQTMTADEFAARHVLRQTPVLLVDALSNSTAAQVWSHHYLTSLPHAMTTWVSVQGKYESAEGALSMTLGEYVRRASNRSADVTLFVNDEVPLFMQKDVVIPKVLLCRDLARRLTSHGIRMGYDKFASPFTQPVEDTMICAISGRLYFDLARTGTSAQRASILSTPSFDCQKSPEGGSEDELAQERLQAKIMSGDCLYIPSTWAYAAKANGQHMAVSLQWEADASAGGSVTCGPQPPASSLLGFARKFVHARQQRNPEDDALLHYFLFYLGDGLASSFTQRQFTRKLKQDARLLGKLTSWDDECTDIANELFEALDVDKNGVYQAEDMQSLKSENVDSIIALIRDRLVDFNGVIAEQQKLEVKKAARKLSSLQDELENRLADELGKVKQQEQPELSDAKAKDGARRGGKQRPTQAEPPEDKRKASATTESDVTTDDDQDYEIVDSDEELEIIADDDDADLDADAGVAKPSPASASQRASATKPTKLNR